MACIKDQVGAGREDEESQDCSEGLLRAGMLSDGGERCRLLSDQLPDIFSLFVQ